MQDYYIQYMFYFPCNPSILISLGLLVDHAAILTCTPKSLTILLRCNACALIVTCGSCSNSPILYVKCSGCFSICLVYEDLGYIR